MSGRIRRFLSFGVIVAGALGASRSLHAQTASPTEGEVMKVVNRLFEGMKKGDSSIVRSVFHPQVRMISSGKGRDGKLRLTVETSADAFVKAVGTPHTVVWNERISNEKVHIDGAIASVWADYTFHAGETFSHCGIDHFLLTSDESGAWKIIELADTRRTEGCTPSTREKPSH